MRWRLVAVVILVVGGAVGLGACGDDGDDIATARVFSFTEHELCEWVSEDDVAGLVASVFDWEGTATRRISEDGCLWELSDEDGGRGVVAISDGASARAFDGGPYDHDARMEMNGTVDYQGQVCIGDFVVGHPALSDGVVVHNGGFGQFAFGVPPQADWLSFDLHVPGRSDDQDWTSCESTGTTGGVPTADFEGRYFSLVDRFLEELGWVADG